MNNAIRSSEKYPLLKPLFLKLEIIKSQHFESFNLLNGGSKRDIYAFDMFLKPILKRSLDLTDAFCNLVDRWHYSVSVSLLRMQLDNLLREYYVYSRTERDKFILSFLESESFHKLKHIDGKPLTDKKLLDISKHKYPWIENVYKETSKLIHLSTKHHTASIIEIDDSDRSITEHFSIGFFNWPELDIQNTLNCYALITNSILDIINEWNKSKK